VGPLGDLLLPPAGLLGADRQLTGTRRIAEKLPGVVARDPASYNLPDFRTLGDGPYPPILQEAMERAGNQFARWDEQVAHTGYCCRPLRMRGRTWQVDRESREEREVYSTEGEPDNALLLPCGSRRASECPSCSSRWQNDGFQVVVAGLRGGKGVPETVISHPKVFVTLTAPSFGAVHAHRTKGNRVLPCRPREAPGRCPHGRPLGCSVRHRRGDPRVGQPLCAECFEHEALVVWNAYAPALFKRTMTYLSRELAREAGMSQRAFKTVVRVECCKVAEYQSRGAVHFHAVIRLDAAGKGVAPPPGRFTVEMLERAVHAVRERARLASPEMEAQGKGPRICWGREISVRPILETGAGEMTAEAVAGYTAKYAVKFSEGLGLPRRRIESAEEIGRLDASPHIRRLVAAAWDLGWEPRFKSLKLLEHAHGLGFGGHFMTKSRVYSTTMGALRAARRRFARSRAAGEGGMLLDAWGRPEDDGLAEKRATWFYLGWGYQSTGEAWLAATAAARAREARELAREELDCVA
jgi:hypothetical protein